MLTKIGCLLRQIRNWHLKVSRHFVKSCKLLSSQVSYRKVLILHRDWPKFVGENTCLEDHLLFLQGKMWMRLFSLIQQTSIKAMWELILVSFIFTLCVKRCLLVSLILNLANPNLVRTRRQVLITWSFHNFREPDRSVKWKVSRRQTQRTKWMFIVFMAFVIFATHFLELWDDNIVFVYVKKLVFLSLRKKFSEAAKKRAREKTKTNYVRIGLKGHTDVRLWLKRVIQVK